MYCGKLKIILSILSFIRPSSGLYSPASIFASVKAKASMVAILLRRPLNDLWVLRVR